MSTLNDNKFQAMREAGYQGALNDMEKAYWVDYQRHPNDC